MTWQAREADFSYTLKIDNLTYTKFGSPKLRESADGFGVSGVSTAEFSFTVPYGEYGSPSPNAAVKIFLGESYKIAPTFYISSRSRKGGTVSFKCYDRMVYTNQTIAVTEKDFTNDETTGFWLVNAIASQCGFSSAVVSGEDISVPREKVEGRSCYEVLQLLSSAWAGYFKASKDDDLVFVPFGGDTQVIPYSGDMRHTAVSEGNIKGPIEQVIMSNGKEEYTSGNNGADVLGTLKISSELASQELANSVMERVDGYIYQSWQCSKIAYGSAATADIAAITAAFEFGDGISRTANYIDKTLTSYGIFISCGANEVTENEFDYTGKLSREIAQKLTDGEELGNKTLITRYQGVIHKGEKEKSGGARSAAEPPKRYGYAPATYEGVVKFEGAMVDKVLPEITVKDDLSGFSTVYGDTVIDYDLEWDGDNVILKEKEAAE